MECNFIRDFYTLVKFQKCDLLITIDLLLKIVIINKLKNLYVDGKYQKLMHLHTYTPVEYQLNQTYSFRQSYAFFFQNLKGALYRQFSEFQSLK